MRPAPLPVPYRCPRCGAVQALLDRVIQRTTWCHHCQGPIRHTRVHPTRARTARPWPPAPRQEDA